MRSIEEIRDAIELLGNKQELLDWKGDSFRYGYLVGKVIALEWILGEAPSHDVGSDYDFEDWQNELKNSADDLREFLSREPPKGDTENQ